MSYQIFFKNGGAELSSIKSTCAGNGIVAAATGDGNKDDGVAAASEADWIVAYHDEGNGSVAAATYYGSVDAALGDGSTVG